MNAKHLLNKQEAAEWLGVKVRTIDNLRRRGVLRAVKFCGAVRFDPADLESLVKMSKTAGQNKVAK